MLNYVSVIVTTSDWPEGLECVLQALIKQKTHRSFEIIVADHGSHSQTAKLIRSVKEQTEIPIMHVWQPEAQKVSGILNKAFVASEGNYIIFLNEGCIPREDFIEKHLKYSKRGKTVCGYQIILSPKLTYHVLSEKGVSSNACWYWLYQWFVGQTDSFSSVMDLPWVFHRRYFAKQELIAHFGVWRTAVQEINGWEETIAFGVESKDFLARLIKAGFPSLYIPFGLSVYQLWHSKLLDKLTVNQVSQSMLLCAEQGLSQYES